MVSAIESILIPVIWNMCFSHELKDFTDDEKADMADDFAEKYEGKVEDFEIEILNTGDIIHNMLGYVDIAGECV